MITALTRIEGEIAQRLVIGRNALRGTDQRPVLAHTTANWMSAKDAGNNAQEKPRAPLRPKCLRWKNEVVNMPSELAEEGCALAASSTDFANSIDDAGFTRTGKCTYGCSQVHWHSLEQLL